VTPREHCESTAVAPGSARYYTLVNATPAVRTALPVVFALADEVRQLAALSAQPNEVRQAKLGWWMEEAKHLADAQPRHPVSRAVLECNLPVERVLSVLQSAMACALSEHLPETTALTNFCIETGGQLGEMAAGLCAPNGNDVNSAAADLGAGAQLFDFATESGHLPITAQAAFQQADRLLEKGDRGVAAPDRYRLLPLLTLSALHRYSLRRLLNGRTTAGITPPAWAPLRSFWITWTLERRERKRPRAR
jgi:hypothetical protein